MSEYQVIARKWRPQRFADVVGQEHIVRTLKNAIREQRTAHAYLFVGPRGIGKTTTARIFAKALNCLAPKDGEPCCKCRSCTSIAAENNIDVIEIDAASQNSVDNIRDLRDEVLHVPINGRYKIYIIDEVHMLSKQAWNALLKTVEEPPPHVKFIFATTEVHMVLPTIISRCQRFDLQRISSRMIADRLRNIAETEKVGISPAALEAIARAADGGMRDAQSLLDQMIAFFSTGGSGTEISEQQVLSLFGLTAANDLEALVQAIVVNDKAAVITGIHTLAARGKNLETLFEEMLDWLRGIQICQLLQHPETVIEDGREAIERYCRLGSDIRPEAVQRLLEILASAGRTLHDALNKQVFIESLILKAMRFAHCVQIDDLLARLNQLRKSGDLDFLDKVPPIEVMHPTDAITPLIPETATKNMATPTKTVNQNGIVKKSIEPKIVSGQTTPITSRHDAAIDKAGPGTPPDVSNQPLPTGDYSKNLPAENENFSLSPGIPESTADINAPPSPEEIWHRIILEFDNHQNVNPLLKGYMQEALPKTLENKILTVVFDEEFDHEHFATVKQAGQFIRKLIPEELLQWISSVNIEKKEGVNNSDQQEKIMQSVRGVPEVRQKIERNEFVKTTLDLFDGQIVDIHG